MKNAAILAKSALIWNAGFSIIRDLLQFASMLYLVRTLPKEAYGQFNLIQSIVGVAAMFSGKMTIDHILQIKSGETPPYQTHFTTAGLMQLAWFFVLNIIAVVFRYVPQFSVVSLPLHVYSLIMLCDWISHFRYRWLERDLQFSRFRTIHMTGILLSTVATLLLATWGFGVYAIILPCFLIAVPFAWDLFIHERWRPTWELDIVSWYPSWKFAKSVMLLGFVSQIKILIENLAFAALSFTLMSSIGRAQGLARMFCVQIVVQVIFSLYPILTRLNSESGQAKRGAQILVQLTAWIAIPVGAFLATISVPIVNTVYGQNWSEVSGMLPPAMLWGALVAFQQCFHYLLLSRNDACFLLKTNIFSLMLCLLGLPCVWLDDIRVWLFLNALSVLLQNVCMAFRLVQLDVIDWAATRESITGPIVACVFAAAAVWGGRNYVQITVEGSFLDGLLWGAAFLVTVALVLRFWFANHLALLLHRMPFSSYFFRILGLGLRNP